MLTISMAEHSIPMLVLAAAWMAFAVSSSPTISIRPGSLSSCSSSSSSPLLLEPVQMVFLSWMYAAARANMMLSLTTSLSSGKCQEYHSRTRIAKVFRSLSIWSSRAMDWMIMLSDRWGLNLTFEREYECPRPSCAFSDDPPSSPFTNVVRCRRQPLRISRTVSSLRHETPPSPSEMAVARAGSMMPSEYFLAFLGRFISRKSWRVSDMACSEIAFAFSRACCAVSKGRNALSLSARPNRLRSVTVSMLSSSRLPISSKATTSKRA
mmetsp:Transcript_23298/g.55111  ORF Transcript_23298/g.55111 Transcript_23298/m.55111 type:complete len:266 (+) Transcript_23298:652-1449(+)